MPKKDVSKSFGTPKQLRDCLALDFRNTALTHESFPGFRVEISKQGTATFTYRYSQPLTKKLKQIKIGAANGLVAMTLNDATEKYLEYVKLRDSGICPVEFRKAQESMAKAEAAREAKEKFSVKQMMEFYIEKRLDGRRTMRGVQTVVNLNKQHILPAFGRRSALNVTSDEIEDRFDAISAKTPYMGNIFVKELRYAYEFAIRKGKLPNTFRNPTTGIDLNKGSRRSRILNDAELKTLNVAIHSEVFTENVGNVLKLAMWTLCRTGELVNLMWNQVNFEDGYIHLYKTKNGGDRIVALSSQALQFLRELKMKSTSHLLFPTRLNPNKPINQQALVQNLYDVRHLLPLDHWTGHDLRRTGRTRVSGYTDIQKYKELLLGHKQPDLDLTYDLYAYTEEQRELLQLLADEYDGIFNNDNVKVLEKQLTTV
ncbi:tyrosine-type recombinase/integrase [Thalassotalea euphylliae]|uniref:tyrosine-type recombinase/integrase n=1 Tax=Thalassotalea euphylliae TaxID=1655234 RepID=UPI00362A19FC